jgi:SAM-dependent methyltransferase
MKTIEKGWDEFWAKILQIKVFESKPTEEINKSVNKLIKHIMYTTKISKKSRILDLACGSGIKTIKFAEKGMDVTGIDFSTTLINYCKKLSNKLNLQSKAHFIIKDIKDIDFYNEFDCITILGRTFELFDYDDNIILLEKIRSSLKNRGHLYLELENPIYTGNNVFGNRHWIELEDGFLLIQSILTKDGTGYKNMFKFITNEGICIDFRCSAKSKSELLRYYFLPEIRRMLNITGFKYIKVYGSTNLPVEEYSKDSKSMIIIASKI